MPADTLEKAEVSLTPLRKKDLKAGRVYTRLPNIEAKLKELLALTHKQLALRCEIRDRKHPDYVPGECLVYLVRTYRNEPASPHFDWLYSDLLERVLRRMPSGASKDGKRVGLEATLVREKVVDRIQELLAKDRNEYEAKLDFYEVRFDSSLKKLIIAVQRQVRRETGRSDVLDNPETGEISAEVLKAAGTFDPFDGENDYRSRLPAAIETLTPEQRRIVTMHSMGIPIDSKDPAAITISKILKRSEKTIRSERLKALAKLKKFLEQGDEE